MSPMYEFSHGLHKAVFLFVAVHNPLSLATFAVLQDDVGDWG